MRETPQSRVQAASQAAAQETPREKVDYHDVDDIIGVAVRMKQADEKRLTIEELEQVAQELEIEPQYVAQAVEALRQRRAQAQAQEQARRAQQRKRVLVAVLVAGALVLVMGSMAMTGRNGLRERLAAARQQHAQVVNVLERQQQVEARLKNLPRTPEHEAELIGSQNRIMVEKKRYNEAATAYNEYAASLRGTLGAWISSDAPDHLPLAHEVTSW